MNINKILLASTALTSLFVTSNGFSQTTNFVGPSLAITGSYIGASSTNELNILVDSAINFTNTPGKRNNFIPGVDFNYGFAAGNNFVIGLGATYDFSKSKIGGLSASVSPDNILGFGIDEAAVIINTELKDHYSLYIQPTYVINKDTAMFAKLGRHFAKTNTTLSISANEVFSESIAISSKKIEGWGYGLGLKAFLSNNLFVQVEGGIVNYEKSEDIYDDTILPISILTKPETINATISVGYKF